MIQYFSLFSEGSKEDSGPCSLRSCYLVGEVGMTS